MLRRKALALALALAGLSAAPARAAGESEMLMQEMRRLAERVEQLEAANRRLEAALGQSTGDGAKEVQVREMAHRIEDLEGEVLSLRRQPRPLEVLEGISAAASLTVVAQKAGGADRDKTQLTARADLDVELPMGEIGQAEGRLFAHLRAGDGNGVDVGSFATSNATTFGNTPQPVLMQAWYQLDIPVGAAGGELDRVEVTVGKIDPFGFFDGNNIADDESETFLNLAFIHNPLLDAGGDIGVGSHGASPGVRVAYVNDVNGGNNLSASLGVFGAGEGGDYLNSFDKPLVIGQLEYAGKTFAGLPGAYRLYAWSNGNATPLDGEGSERHSGWGVSLDQQVSPHLTLFSRLGYSTDGEVAFDRAFTLGAQVAGGAWGRADDHLGLAWGWLDASKASGQPGAEKLVELYYAWRLNEHLAISPDVQWIQNPGGDTSADSVTVWGLRAKASF